jgi:hypothetical protein
MAETQEHNPTAFVIMPFGDGLDEIYSLFLVETRQRHTRTRLRNYAVEGRRSGVPHLR